MRAETAAYIEIWARRIVGVAVSGIAFANVALLLGLHRAGYAALLRMVMLVVHLFVVVIILQCRRQVADAIRAPAGREGIAARLRNRIAGGWHYLAIALDLALWAVWALNIRNGYSLLLQYFVGTIAVVLITRRRHHGDAEPDRPRLPHPARRSCSAFPDWRSAPTAICRCCARSSPA